MPKHHVIIGASAAGIAVINKLARMVPDHTFTCITGQSELPYNKCLIADYLAGNKKQEEILLSSMSGRFINNTRVIQLDPQSRSIMCDNGIMIEYDTLFLGMGCSPILPPFARSISFNNMFTFNSFADAQAIEHYIQASGAKRAVIIGAGISGVECADALQKKGLQVTLVERNQRVMSAFLDAAGSFFLEGQMEAQGIRILCNQEVKSVSGDIILETITLSSGIELGADLLILATGLKPNIELALQAGIAVQETGISVNQFLQTSVADIYAGGDIITVMDQLTGNRMRSCLWPDAMLQGMHAALAMAGQHKPYMGASLITSSSFFGIHMAQAGILEPQAPGDELVIKLEKEYYHKFLMQNGKLKGFMVLGNTHNFSQLRREILTS